MRFPRPSHPRCESRPGHVPYPPSFVHRSLDDFNAGALDASEAASRLGMSRSHLFRLRHRHLNGKPVTAVSGGNHLQRWPEAVQAVRAAFLARPEAPNFQLIADQIASRLDFTRHRTSVAAHARRYVAATFVPSDTTWGHFEHFRAVFLRMGLPMAIYTDGLSLFGHESTAEGRDPKSEFQRALTALGVSHLVAPSPQAKGKIERRFGTLQGRVVTLLGHEKVQSFAHAQVVLQAEIDHLNRTVCRTTGMSPNDRWDRTLQDGMTVMQPVPSTALLDLHLAIHDRRSRNTDNPVDFEGRSWAIAPTLRKTVSIIHHPGRQFWVVTEPPAPPENRWPEVLGK
ncbi:MAG: hypothetical protein RL153_1086 [Verrucomicrobiota bacterium]